MASPGRSRSAFLTAALLWTAAVCLSAGAQGKPNAPVPCPRCGWTPPATSAVQSVRSAADLYRVVASVKPNTTVLLVDGIYTLDRMLDIVVPGTVVRSASGDPAKVTIRGAGMTEGAVGVALSVSAPNVTIADLTVGFVGYHGIQVRGERGASNVSIHNVRIVDTGQQLIKGSTDGGAMHSDNGLVACSTLEYTDAAPSDYTNGIDIIAGNGWTVRDNTLRRIRGPRDKGSAAGPAILFWGNSQNTRVERNTIVDSYRGIALGLGPGASGRLARDGERGFDHQGGWIRNNVVVNTNTWADEGIEANAAGNVAIEHNTVLTLGLPWSISLRFPQTSGYARNNLTSRAVLLRDGSRAERAGNVDGAASDWFVDAEHGNLALRAAHQVDAGASLDDGASR